MTLNGFCDSCLARGRQGNPIDQSRLSAAVDSFCKALEVIEQAGPAADKVVQEIVKWASQQKAESPERAPVVKSGRMRCSDENVANPPRANAANSVNVAAERALIFLSTLNLQDHSIEEQRAYLDVVRGLKNALRPTSETPTR